MSSKASRKRTKARIEFELNPPRCGSCQHYQPTIQGTPQKDAQGVKFTPYQAPFCTKHNIACKPHSICNDWRHGLTGETLEAIS